MMATYSLALSSRRSRRAFTFTEVMFVTLITLIISLTVLSVMIFTARTYVTAAAQSRTRTDMKGMIDLFNRDVRQSSRGWYNRAEPSTRLVKNASAISVRLWDAQEGIALNWTFDRQTGVATRRERQFDVSGAVLADRTRQFRVRLTDIDLAEVTRADGGGTQLVTGLFIRGRVLLDLRPNNTVFAERDGNNDGRFGDDRVGANLFGRTFRNDDPGWQQVFAVPTTFRNT